MGERVFKIENNRYNPHKNPNKNKYEYLFIILVYKTDLNETFSKCYFKINVISRYFNIRNTYPTHNNGKRGTHPCLSGVQCKNIVTKYKNECWKVVTEMVSHDE